MYIIVAGAGVVGLHIASTLVEGKHEVTVIEPSAVRHAGDVARGVKAKNYVGFLAALVGTQRCQIAALLRLGNVFLLDHVRLGSTACRARFHAGSEYNDVPGPSY